MQFLFNIQLFAHKKGKVLLKTEETLILNILELKI